MAAINESEAEKFSLRSKFIEVSGTDDAAEGKFESDPRMIHVDTVSTIMAHPKNKDKTFVERYEGHTDCYIDRPYEQVRTELFGARPS